MFILCTAVHQEATLLLFLVLTYPKCTRLHWQTNQIMADLITCEMVWRFQTINGFRLLQFYVFCNKGVQENQQRSSSFLMSGAGIFLCAPEDPGSFKQFASCLVCSKVCLQKQFSLRQVCWCLTSSGIFQLNNMKKLQWGPPGQLYFSKECDSCDGIHYMVS